MEDILNRIDNLSASQLKVFEEKLRKKGYEINNDKQIVKIVSNDKIHKTKLQQSYKLSPVQKSLYFLYELDRSSTAYNMLITVELDNAIKKDKLSRVFNLLVERHESLRTSFELINGEPVQKISNNICVDIECFDTQEDNIQPLIEKFIRPFDLSQAPLIRVGVIESKSKGSIMLIDIHHIITDAISNTILREDFYKLYHGEKLSPLPLQYKDYSEWQRTEEQQSKIQKQTQYWLKELQGNLPILNLPIDFQRTNTDSDAGGSVSVYINPEENEILKKCCRKYDTTTSILLYTAFSILISKLSGQKDIIIGLATSGRTHSDLEGIVGMFVNSLPVRSFPEHDKLITEFINETKASLLQAYENQNCPFNYLTEKLDIERTIGRNPVFDVMLNFIEHVDSVVDLSGKQTSEYKHSQGAKRFDITLNVTQFLNTLSLRLQYDSNLFCAETAELFLRYLRNIILTLEDIGNKRLYEISLEKEDKVVSIYNELLKYPLDKCSSEELVAASYHQERLWFIDKFESGFLYEASPDYHNIPLIIGLKGEINFHLLEKSIQTVIERYEVLRTQIISIDERPFQKVFEETEFKLTKENSRRSTKETNELLFKEFKRPFTLNELLVRSTIYYYGSNKYKLLITLHHSIVDRYSVAKLAEEVLHLYSTNLKSNKINKTRSLLQYSDFSQWQLNSLMKLDFYLFSYWKHQLKGKLKALEFPIDKPRAAIHVYTGASIDAVVPKDLCSKVLGYSTVSGIGVNVILMAAFKVLLQKYSKHEEIVIGTSLNNRNHECLRGTIGPIANLIVIRSFVSPIDCFNDYVTVLNEIFNAGVKYQALPFDKLVSELSPKKDMSRTALFDVLFQYEDSIYEIPNIDGVDISVSTPNLGYGKYDLNLLLRRNENDEIQGELVYNSDYFNYSTINSFISHYYQILSQLLTDPYCKLSEIEVLTIPEKNELLNEFDNTGIAYPKEKTLIDLFVEQVKRSPDNIAVKTGNRTFTYGEIDKSSSKLATLLKDRGIRVDQVVALLTDRSIETIIGMLAIIKAGGAYLPIDVDYPETRIKYMIEDSGAKILLTTKEFIGETPYDIPTLYIEDFEKVSDEDALIEYTSKPSDLCYIIYTSGTTGNPKGVMVEHRNVVRLFYNDKFQFDFGSNDVWTMFHSHCFDFSVWEMYGALLFGGKLIVVPKFVAKDTVSYLDIIAKEGVTVLNQTPSAFYNLMHNELASSEKRLSLRYVIFGGEALAPGKLKEWREKYSNVKLINMFGITETTVHVTYKEIEEYEIENNISSIGKPIPTLSTYIFDEYWKLVPKGIKGELYVGGVGVTRGYIGKAELTNQKYILNPYKPGEILYRSGDLVRIIDDGDIEYIGRVDNQVQLRGFRIELGEVESELNKIEVIKDCVVVAKDDVEGNKRLVAYIVSDDESNIQEIREGLSRSLPDYMVPTLFVRMEILPLTPNGKIDRKALPEPQANIETTNEFVAPRTETEKKLAAIWSELLGVEKVGIYDDFFELGGHSVLATQVISKIKNEFSIELPIKTLFEEPDLLSFSRTIENTDLEKKITEIKQAGREDLFKVKDNSGNLEKFRI